MLVEASKAVPWTAPDDVRFDLKYLPNLGGQFPEGFHAVMADGSVRFFKRDMKPFVLRALITIAGGEVVQLGTGDPRWQPGPEVIP